MPRHKFPPAGYRKMEHPLPHNFSYSASFDILDVAKDATMLTILRASEDATAGIEAVEVNPRHASFAEETGPTIAMGSIVPKISFTFRSSLSATMIVDNPFASVQIHLMPVYTAFLSSLDAADSKTTEDIESIIRVAHDVTAKRVEPENSTTNLTSGGGQPFNTVLETEVFGDYGLTGDGVLESIAFDPEKYFDALSYFTNQAMLRKVTGHITTGTMTRDRNFTFHSNNFTSPIVKRGNEYTYCGVIVWTSIPGIFSHGNAGDFNGTDLDKIHFNAQIRFDEWNPDFDQTTA